MSYLVLTSLFVAQAQSSSFLISAGTDIPYQFHVGAAIQIERLRVSFKSGLLYGPYSDLTMSLIEALGTPEIYVNLLDSAYDLGSMNGLALQCMIGKKRLWSIGPELRFDYLTASDTPSDLLEAVVGDIEVPALMNKRGKDLEVRLGLMTYAVGLRFGREFVFGTSSQHLVHTDLSVYKHYATQSALMLNDEQPEELNKVLDDLLWEDVFRPYGYLGGLGAAYSYRF